MTPEEPRYRLRSSTRYRTVFDEGLALDQETAELHVLNPAAATILEALTEPKTVEELTATVIARFDVDHATAKRDVEAFLDAAVEKGLLETV